MGGGKVSRLSNFLEIPDKCLISLTFGVDPDLLWITLLKTGPHRATSLENQAFHCSAHLLSRK
jgi:hypothetical protein